MKKIILLELVLLFLGTTFQGDGPPAAWYLLPSPRTDLIIKDIDMLDSLTGCFVAYKYPNEDSSFIYKTTNGGNNWELKFQSPGRYKRIQFPDSLTGYTVRNSQVGSMYKTTNRGENWFYVNQNLTPISDIYYVNKNTGWCCMLTEFGGTYKTTNGGLNWIMQLSGSYGIEKLFFINTDTGWALGADAIYKTTNSGINWNHIYNFNNIPIYDFYMLNNNTGWTTRVGENSIFKTTDGCLTWKQQIDPFAFGSGCFDIKAFTERKAWISTSISGIISLFNDSIWGKQQVPPPPPYVNYFTIDLLDTLIGYSGGGSGRLIKTNDGGGVITNTGNTKEVLPDKFDLSQNYPNPFNQSSIIKYKCSINGFVTIKLYNIQGKEIATIINEEKEAGSYQVKFDAGDLPSGIYFYMLSVDNVPVSVRKMVIQK